MMIGADEIPVDAIPPTPRFKWLSSVDPDVTDEQVAVQSGDSGEKFSVVGIITSSLAEWMLDAAPDLTSNSVVGRLAELAGRLAVEGWQYTPLYTRLVVCLSTVYGGREVFFTTLILPRTYGGGGGGGGEPIEIECELRQLYASLDRFRVKLESTLAKPDDRGRRIAVETTYERARRFHFLHTFAALYLSRQPTRPLPECACPREYSCVSTYGPLRAFFLVTQHRYLAYVKRTELVVIATLAMSCLMPGSMRGMIHALAYGPGYRPATAV